MKKLAKLIGQLVLPLAFPLILGCQKELVDLAGERDHSSHSHDSISSVSIEEAKAYFDANFSASVANKKIYSHGEEKLLEHKLSKWDKAGYKQISFGEAVVVPMGFEKLNLIIDEKTGAYVPYDQLNYLMMYKDRHKKMVTEWVTLLPDSSWLNGKRDVYTGNIMVRTWEGKYLKMYQYSKDGTIKGFKINPSTTFQNGRTSDYSPGTYTTCMRVRIEENCTCSNKYDCDMCLICAPEYCYTMTLVTDDPEPPVGGGGNTGGIGAGNTNNSGGSGYPSGNGDNYTPRCNPNLPPGTSVPSNQLPPCNPMTPVGPITVRYPITESYGIKAGNFVMSRLDQIKYPRFTEMVKNLPNYVQNNPNVMNALKHYSGFSEKEIMDKLKFDQGPVIVIKHLEGEYGNYRKSTNNPHIISNLLNVDADFVRGLEKANLPVTIQGTEFLLAVTVLHELVHFGRATNGLDINTYEYGVGFENMAFGLTIYEGNAKEYSFKFYKK